MSVHSLFRRRACAGGGAARESPCARAVAAVRRWARALCRRDSAAARAAPPPVEERDARHYAAGATHTAATEPMEGALAPPVRPHRPHAPPAHRKSAPELVGAVRSALCELQAAPLSCGARLRPDRLSRSEPG